MKYLNLFKLQYMVILILGCLFISSCTEEDMTVGTLDVFTTDYYSIFYR